MKINSKFSNLVSFFFKFSSEIWNLAPKFQIQLQNFKYCSNILNLDDMLKGMLEHKSSKFEPLMYLQARLGHSSITTTMKYLHLVNDLVDDLSIEYQQQIDAIV